MKLNLPAKFFGTYKFSLVHADGSSEEFVTHNTACTSIGSAQFASTLSLGNGTGEPSYSDTRLFSFLWNIAATSTSTITNVGDNGARISLVFDVPATSSYVGTITEVGLGSNGSIWTHALIADAEGNPISIDKADTDKLTIDVTVELYITSDFPLVHGHSPINKGGKEITLAALLLATIASRSAYDNLTGYWASSDYVPWKTLSVIPTNMIGSKNRTYNVGKSSPSTTAITGLSPAFINWSSNNTLVGNFRHTTEGFNGHYYRYLQFMWGAKDTSYMWESCDLFAIAMGMDLTDPDVFSPQAFNGVTIATGDGATTAFACPLNYFKKDSEVLYKNGVALTRGVDYTIEHCANKSRLSELMHWAATDPDAIKITGSHRTSTVQFAPEQYSGTYDKDRACGSFEDGTPLHIDWGEARKCNHLHGYLNRYYAKEIFVEYSTDDSTWHEVANLNVETSSSTGTEIALSWPAVTARYWRIRVTKYGTDASKTHYAYFSGSYNFFGYYDLEGIRFTEAPAEGDLITMDCVSDIPFKNENFVFNLALDITLSFS